MIQLNLNGNDVCELFKLPQQRADQMMSHFNIAFCRHKQLLAKRIDDMRDSDAASVTIDFNPIIQDCVKVSTNEYELGFASYSASKMVEALGQWAADYADASPINLIKKLMQL
jgi:hypothetical protein